LSQQVKYVTKKACYYQSSVLFCYGEGEMHTFIQRIRLSYRNDDYS